MSNFSAHGLCDASFTTDVIASNLRRALTEYATYKMTQPPAGQLITIIIPPPLKGGVGHLIEWINLFALHKICDQSINQSINQSISQPTKKPTNQPNNQSIN
jgi:hypothetical protein